MTGQAKRRENEKRKACYQLKSAGCAIAEPNKGAVKKALSRAGLPKNPEKFAGAIEKAIENATPEKKKALFAKGLTFSSRSKRKAETNAKIVQ